MKLSGTEPLLYPRQVTVITWLGVIIGFTCLYLGLKTVDFDIDAMTDAVSPKLQTLKVPVHLPENLLSKLDPTSFRVAMVEILNYPSSPEAKAFMHLAVEEIRIYADETTVPGSNLGVLRRWLNKRGTLHLQCPHLCAIGGEGGIRTLGTGIPYA